MPSALTPVPTAILIGASSGIGEALARKLAREGYVVALVARRGDLLEKLCGELNAQHGAGRAHAYVHDVTRYAEAPLLLQRILADLGRVDIVIYNSGAQHAVELNEYDFDKDRQMLEVNLLGALAWLNPAAQMFEQLGAGQLVGISSVAGDRGRVGAPGYNASKAALSTFLEALRNRLTRQGVHVLTVKPGMVATDMLRNAKKVLWVIPPEQAADDIWKAIRARQQVIYTPARWGLLMLVIRHIPSFVFRRLRF
jgi:short-subunit dehydrogenase